MNAILLGAASLGALIAIFTAEPANLETAQDVGSMTHTTLVDPGTGEKTEVSVISFID